MLTRDEGTGPSAVDTVGFPVPTVNRVWIQDGKTKPGRFLGQKVVTVLRGETIATYDGTLVRRDNVNRILIRESVLVDSRFRPPTRRTTAMELLRVRIQVRR